MPTIWIVLGLTWAAGLTMSLGALLARVEHIRPHWLEREVRHTVLAVGAGALVAAVALILVPNGIEHLPIWAASLSFFGGAVAFMGLDWWLDRQETNASQLAAMLTDFIPESLALGAAFAIGQPVGMVLAVILAAQNLPEGFNAYREMTHESELSSSHVLWMFFAASFAGPAAGLVGYYLLSDLHVLTGTIKLVAAGGILYSVFQDIAPQVALERRWAPPLGATLGFLIGMIGMMVIEGG